MATTADIAILITAQDKASPEVKAAGKRIQETAQTIGKSMMGIGVATMGAISVIKLINPALAESLAPLMLVAKAMTVVGALMTFLSSTAGVKLIAMLSRLAVSIYAFGASALVAAGKMIVLAASQIWAWASGIPFIGIGLAIAGVAAMAASVWAVRNKIATLGEGGIITRPTLALIGERGPEAVVPLRGGGLAPITINIGTWLGDREGVERLTDRIMESLRGRQRLAMGKAQF